MPVLKSVSSELPDPPYPADIKANGWKPEFDIDRICQSDTWTLAEDDERPWLLRTWLEAWRSVPVGSMPGDRGIFARRIGCTRSFLEAHASVLLRGWRLHSDERLYHDYITEQVDRMLKKRRNTNERQRRSRQNKKTRKINETSEMSRVTHCDSRVSHAQEQEQEQEEGREVTGTLEVDGSFSGDPKSEIVPLSLSRSGEKSQNETRSTKTPETGTKDKPHATSCDLEDVQQVLDLLNKLSGHAYRLRNARGELTVDAKRIRTRIDQWNLEDVLSVVEKKCSQWKHDETMQKYLRPGTLFHPEKFEQYLGERQATKAAPGSFLDDSPIGNIFEGEYARA